MKGTSTGSSTYNFVSPTHATGTYTATGPLSPLGANVSTQGVVTSIDFVGNSFSGTTNFTLVAANGDNVFARTTGSGTASGNTVGSTSHATVVATITGGTGRFARATGQLTSTNDSVVASINGGTLTTHDNLNTQGTIRY